MTDPWGREIIKVIGSDEVLPDGALLFEPRKIYAPARCGVVLADGVRVAAYSRERIYVALMVAEGFTYEGACEWVSYNTEGEYVGPNTPVVLPVYADA